MNETGSLFLASLSHRWAPAALALPVIFGALTYTSGVLLARSRAAADKRVWRLALAARVLSFNLLAFSILVLGISVTYYGCAAVKSHSVGCMSNLKALGMGALMYAQDYDDRLPPASHWDDAISRHVIQAAKSDNFRSPSDPFHCPAAESTDGYGMNASLGGASLADRIDAPASTILFFDADASTRSFAGGAQNLARHRHQNAPNIAFADGHVKGGNADAATSANWLPTVR